MDRNKKTAYIVYENYLTPDGRKMSIGGIQTYITNLIPIIQSFGYKIHLYQRSSLDFDIEVDGIHITGISYGEKVKDFVNCLEKTLNNKINKESDILVFGCETLAFESKQFRSIAIQHGITWDRPDYSVKTRIKYIRRFLGNAKRSWFIIKRVSKARQIVCVDYNFVNWYRALTAYPLVKLNVIPNFTRVLEKFPNKPKSPINIIFARRLFEYRGTRIFATAVKPLLESNCNISVTIAGSGPDEKFLRDNLGNFNNVSFISYASEESLLIHTDKHIAVVPTLGSEGTSLSLLEAMAAGCAVICTNVGGMTNIVLDHYNGIMISPDEIELYEALKLLIEDDKLRMSLAQKAYESANGAFSINKWRESWEKVIRKAEE